MVLKSSYFIPLDENKSRIYRKKEKNLYISYILSFFIRNFKFDVYFTIIYIDLNI